MDQSIKRLQRPFAEADIEWTVTFTYGNEYDKVMIGVAPYIKRESIMTRLDRVIGPTHWSNIVQPYHNSLYQAISIDVEGREDPIVKWDGAALPTGENDRIDPVKTVHTQSFRRAAEVFGIGRYVKFMPQMFAIKRPEDDYDAAESTMIKPKGQGQKFKVRWDPPNVPAEFLPVYMTPEQYDLLKRMVKYFDGDDQKRVSAIISGWEEDPDSVSYEDATTKIKAIETAVARSIGRQKPTATVPRQTGPPRQPKQNKPAPDKKESPPAQGETQRQPASTDSQETDNGKELAPGSDAYKDLFTKVYRPAKFLMENDVTGVYYDRKELQQIFELMKESLKPANPSIESSTLKGWGPKIHEAATKCKAEMDDLPF